MISGGVCVVWWKHLSGGIFDLYELLPGFLCSMIAIVLVTVMTGRPEDKVLASFDSMRQRL